MFILNRLFNFKVIFFLICLNVTSPIYSNPKEVSLPTPWVKLLPILEQRVNQKNPKMKLTITDVETLNSFLENLKKPTPQLLNLQLVLPKTTIELLRSIQKRGVSIQEAEQMAAYLNELHQKFSFKHPEKFDENTSHIIGREWSEIDYSGEGMTWQNQKKKYAPYGITNFKTLDNLKKFFVVESKLPYFKTIYKPTGMHLGLE